MCDGRADIVCTDENGGRGNEIKTVVSVIEKLFIVFNYHGYIVLSRSGLEIACFATWIRDCM